MVKECNDLHLAFIQFKEQNEKTQKDLKKRVAVAEKYKIEFEDENIKLKCRISELELESTLKSEQLISCKCRPKFGKFIVGYIDLNIL